jgi:hypothetical protein
MLNRRVQWACCETPQNAAKRRKNAAKRRDQVIQTLTDPDEGIMKYHEQPCTIVNHRA